MTSYLHKNLVQDISRLNKAPQDSSAYERWVASEYQLEFLNSNSRDDELVIYAGGNRFFVHGVAVNSDLLIPLEKEDLIGWSGNPYGSRAGYNIGFEESEVWIEEGFGMHGSKTIEKAQQLVFMRTFDGLNEDPTYCEILQEFLHLSEIHWRSEFSSYCCFNENGDFDHVISVTIKDNIQVVSVQREALELYLAASNSVLIRMFDFMCYRSGEFTSWAKGHENQYLEDDEIFYRQKINSDKSGYTRGIQIVPMSRSKSEIFSMYHDIAFGTQKKEYVEFEAYDWRNERKTKISTDPDSTTNYFAAPENSLPFDTSPVFFRPEVLSKYKNDRDKYVYDELSGKISCRNQWVLQRIDLNDAGQVNVLICDLRMLPYAEQLHWRSYNEGMKAGISKQAFERYFLGNWYSDDNPLQDVFTILEGWGGSHVSWWTLRSDKLLNQTTAPRIESKDDWGQSFMDLSHLVIEGFVPKVIRRELDKASVSFEETDRSIVLLEKLLVAKSVLEQDEKLIGLKTVNHLRNKVRAHAGSSDLLKLSRDALRLHESYSNHFLSICRTVSEELSLIEKAFMSS